MKKSWKRSFTVSINRVTDFALWTGWLVAIRKIVLTLPWRSRLMKSINWVAPTRPFIVMNRYSPWALTPKWCSNQTVLQCCWRQAFPFFLRPRGSCVMIRAKTHNINAFFLCQLFDIQALFLQPFSGQPPASADRRVKSDTVVLIRIVSANDTRTLCSIESQIVD